MGGLEILRPVEMIFVDPEHLGGLVRDRGQLLASRMTHTVLEEIAERLTMAEAAWQAGEIQRLAKIARSVVGLAEQVGLATVAHVAGMVAEATTVHDDHALAALVARLVRVGEGSLAALWDISHLRI
jgi:hypothetical protein